MLSSFEGCEICCNFPNVEHAQKLVAGKLITYWLSIPENHFSTHLVKTGIFRVPLSLFPLYPVVLALTQSAIKIVSALTQSAMKLFPR
jgi:hypothetical protein